MTPDSSVQHHPDLGRFEIETARGNAFMDYTLNGRCMIISHTFVPETLRGRGFAEQLVRAAFAEARARQYQVVPQCSYVAHFLERHPEFRDLLK
jgi:predicted GNAT family acetyltransferase